MPPAGTVYHSWSWGEWHTREILNRHPQVVNFSGHVHGSLRNDVFLWQGEFTAVNAGKRHVADADGFYATGDSSKPCYTGPAAEWTWGAK